MGADYYEVMDNFKLAEYYRAIGGFYNSAYCYKKALRFFNTTLRVLQNMQKDKRTRYVTPLKITFEQLRSEILPAEIRHCVGNAKPRMDLTLAWDNLLKRDYGKAISEADLMLARDPTDEGLIMQSFFLKSVTYLVQGKETEYLAHAKEVLEKHGRDTRLVDTRVVPAFGVYGLSNPNIYRGRSVPHTFPLMWFNIANELRQSGVAIPLGLLVKQAEASFSVELFRILEKYEEAVEANRRHVRIWKEIGNETKADTEAVIGSLLIQQGHLLYPLGDLKRAKLAYEEAWMILDSLGRLSGNMSITPGTELLRGIKRCGYPERGIRRRRNPEKYADYYSVQDNLKLAEYYRRIGDFYNSSYCYKKAVKYYNATLQALRNLGGRKRQSYVTGSKTRFEQLMTEVVPDALSHCQSRF